VTQCSYHDSGDLVNREGFDFDQYMATVKAMIATLATVAEIQ